MSENEQETIAKRFKTVAFVKDYRLFKLDKNSYRAADEDDDSSSGSNAVSSHSGSGGCDAGMSGLMTLIILSGFALTRKK